MKIVRNSVCMLFVIALSAPLGASTIIPGNSTDEARTFDTPMQAYFVSREGDSIYVGAGAPGAKQYALSIYGRGIDRFAALVPETIPGKDADKNSKDAQTPPPNPLYDAPIVLLNSLTTRDSFERGNDHPLVVLASQPAALYLLEHHLQVNHFSFFSVPCMIDAMGQYASKIIALEGLDRIAFVALKNNAGEPFGAPGSGIGMAMRYETIDEKSGSNKKDIGLKQISVLPLECRSGILKIEQDLAAMGDIVDMHWDPILERLYIALQVTAADHPLAGARALVVACVLGSTEKMGDEADKFNTKYKVLFNGFAMSPCAPVGAFNTDNQIVGGVGAGAQVTVHKVRTMHTTTDLSYLITLGGNGAPEATKRAVYALPLLTKVNKEQELLLGTLAARDGAVEDIYTPGSVARFVQRVIGKQATKPEDLFTTDEQDPRNTPALVGGGALLAGDISDIFVNSDAVFAIVPKAVASYAPGIFHSQALFDETGRIKGWTAWQRVAGTTESICGARLDEHTGDFTLLLSDADGGIRVVRKTGWSNPSAQTDQVTASAAPAVGMQGLEEFDFGDGESLRTGRGGVRLKQRGQTGIDERVYADGAVSGLGEVTCAVSTEEGVVFVGGDHGLVRINPHSRSGNDTQKIGDCRLVKKIIQDQDFLYVLSATTFDRINLADDELPIVRLASVADLIPDHKARFNMTFADCIVAGPLALLASRMGLFRVGDGCDVRTAAQVSAVSWTPVTMPGGYRAASCFFAATQTGEMADLMTGCGGNLYVVSSDIDKGLSRVHRFAIKGSDNEVVHSTTVQPIPHVRVYGMPSHFRQCRGLARSFVTDGAVFWYTQSRQLTKSPSLRSIKVDNPKLERVVPVNTEHADRITRVSRNKATGSWIMTGDCVSVNE